jgi:hypothetical protein
VNSSDPSGEYTPIVEEWARAGSERVAQEAVEAREAELAAIRAAEEAAAREEAERQAALIAAGEAETAAYEAYWGNYAANYEASFWATWNAGIAAEGGGGGGGWLRNNATRAIDVVEGDGCSSVNIAGRKHNGAWHWGWFKRFLHECKTIREQEGIERQYSEVLAPSRLH